MGLFDKPLFDSAEGFRIATEGALETAQGLVEEISGMGDNPSMEVAVKMDELSDALCQVADLSECMRFVHSDPSVRDAAQNASLRINSFVEELNTDTSLHRSLSRFMTSPEFATADRVTQRTTELLMHDFEVSGIHLDREKRERVVELNNRILELSHHFMHNTSIPTLVPRENCPKVFLKHFSTSSDGERVLVDHVPYHSLDSELRSLSYCHYFANDPTQRAILEAILDARHEVSQIAGYPSFAHRMLRICMARNPETVQRFLEGLSEKLSPLAAQDVENMQQFIPTASINGTKPSIRAWDVTLCTSEAQRTYFTVKNSELREYFSLKNTLYGLANLFHSLFGVTMETVPTKTGEIWDNDVIKLAFVDETVGLLGYTYCDLFARPGKSIGDCHFTIQGGRELCNGTYQIPIIALCCNFQRGGCHGNIGDVLLSQHAVENLFHEMGHALHSMLGRSRYQNVTGTRCSTDFAEVPSTLMEYFLSDSRVLQSFARHYKTGRPIPESHLSTFQLSGKLFPAFDTQMQAIYALTDLLLHTEKLSEISCTDFAASVYDRFAPIKSTPKGTWLLRFNHFYGYGARYYSYLWARAVSCLIWQQCFMDDPFSRERGKEFREMLRYGGGMPPEVLVKDMLTFEPTVEDLIDALYQEVLEHRTKLEILQNQR